MLGWRLNPIQRVGSVAFGDYIGFRACRCWGCSRRPGRAAGILLEFRAGFRSQAMVCHSVFGIKGSQVEMQCPHPNQNSPPPQNRLHGTILLFIGSDPQTPHCKQPLRCIWNTAWPELLPILENQVEKNMDNEMETGIGS